MLPVHRRNLQSSAESRRAGDRVISSLCWIIQAKVVVPPQRYKHDGLMALNTPATRGKRLTNSQLPKFNLSPDHPGDFANAAGCKPRFKLQSSRMKKVLASAAVIPADF